MSVHVSFAFLPPFVKRRPGCSSFGGLTAFALHILRRCGRVVLIVRFVIFAKCLLSACESNY